jgi:hypothetical protein
LSREPAGYLDPEYLLTCQLACKSVEYSFAVVCCWSSSRGGRRSAPGRPEEDDTNQPRVLLRHDREIMGVHVREELGFELPDDAAELVMPCQSLTGEERPAVSEVADKIERLREAVHAEM